MKDRADKLLRLYFRTSLDYNRVPVAEYGTLVDRGYGIDQDGHLSIKVTGPLLT